MIDTMIAVCIHKRILRNDAHASKLFFGLPSIKESQLTTTLTTQLARKTSMINLNEFYCVK